MKNLRILLLALALFSVNLALAQTGDTAERSPVVQHCQQLMNLTSPVETGPDAPSIRIVKPLGSDVVYGSQVSVSVETQNFELNADGQHWHIWVDGQLVMMVYGPTALIDVAPGAHEICAIMGDANHADLGIPAGIAVSVALPGAGTPTSTPLVSADTAASYSSPEPDDTLSNLILIFVLGLVAAVAGWRLGARLPKRRR